MGRLEGVREALLQVVGREDCVAAGLSKALCPEEPEIHVCPQHDESAPGEGVQPPDGVGPIVLELELLGPLANEGNRQVRLQLLDHAHGARAGSAASVRGRKGLVEIEVDDIEAHVTRPEAADEGVEVRTIVVGEAAGLVDQLADLPDVALEEPEGVRVGQHDAGDVVAQEAAKSLQIYQALLR